MALLMQDSLTINSFFVQEKVLGLKEAPTNILNSARSSITRLIFKETLTSINFPDYQHFNDATEAYDDFIQ